MRTLHVAALPFPSAQGTQALLHQLLCALANAGHDTHLLCYAHGTQHGTQRDALPYTVHRCRAQGFTRSLRSGPSLDKLWLDLSLARRLESLLRELAPERVVAHHVEAAALALSLGIEPLTFVAHTSLHSELPVYFSSLVSRPLSFLGRQLDVGLIRRSEHTFAVSPLLADMLSEQSGREVSTLPLPWPVPAESTPEQRLAARAALGLDPAHEVALYAGNLDAYQGLDALLPALARTARERPAFRLLIASAADTAQLARQLLAHGLGPQTRFTTIEDEPARRRAHAAASLALVPRKSPGGIPIKLLDAFARGTPVLAARRALADLNVTQDCAVVEEQDSGAAWSSALRQLLDDPGRAEQRARLARRYVEQQHAPERLVAALTR